MIKAGCAGAHPEDISFLLSGEVAELLCSRNIIIDPVSVPPDETSVDVLFVDANKVNKLTAANALRSRPWVMLSSDKTDAWRAWELGAVYFLLRPIRLPDLAEALERMQQSYYWKKQLPPPMLRERILEVQITKGRRIAIDTRDILFLEAQGELTYFFLARPGQEKIVATRNLGYWEQQLEAAKFLRIHKKFLVNIARVNAVEQENVRVGQYFLPVAKRRKKEVENAVFSHQMLYSFPENPPESITVTPLVEKK